MLHSSFHLTKNYHKPDVLLKNNILTPIHVGRNLLSKKTDEKSVENFKILSNSMIGDNTGLNISDKNSCYNEFIWRKYYVTFAPFT